jgi:hypothetical protein
MQALATQAPAHADYILSQIAQLSPAQLAATGQQHIELGELMVRLSETIKSMTDLELAESLPVLLRLPRKPGRPRKTDSDKKWPRTKRRGFKREIAQWMHENGTTTEQVEVIAKHFNVAPQAVTSTIRSAKYGPPARLVDGWVIFDGPLEPLQVKSEPVKEEKRVTPAKPEKEQPASEFDELLADQIHKLLASEGNMPVHAIAARLNTKPVKVSECCRECDWFTNTLEGDIAIAMS